MRRASHTDPGNTAIARALRIVLISRPHTQSLYALRNGRSWQKLSLDIELLTWQSTQHLASPFSLCMPFPENGMKRFTEDGVPNKGSEKWRVGDRDRQPPGCLESLCRSTSGL